MSAVGTLRDWFRDLGRQEQEEVLEFLYDRVLLKEGTYCGPHPGLVSVQKGLFCGPAPARATFVCPTCGRAR